MLSPADGMLRCYDFSGAPLQPESGINLWHAHPEFEVPERWVSDRAAVNRTVPAVRYSLAVTAADLRLEISAVGTHGHSGPALHRPALHREGPGSQQSRQGRFIENLWRDDVAELFILGYSGQYQEFNFSFDGAWWSAGFSGYRTIDAGFTPPSNLRIETIQTTNMRRIKVYIPLSKLWFSITSISDLHANVCAIIGQKPRHYFSVAELESEKPDFHRLEGLAKAVPQIPVYNE